MRYIRKLGTIFFLVLLMFCISAFSNTASAADSGSCGAGAKWSYNADNGRLLIYGTGNMANYNYPSYSPWYGFASKIKSVTIGKEITSIGSWAFEECSALNRVIILSENLTYVGEGAFCNCKSLSSIALPETVTVIKGCAFFGCTSLKSFSFPSKVTAVSEKIFYWCQKLENVKLTPAIRSIGKEAFYNCSELRSIILPSSVRTIGEYSFYSCSKLDLLAIPEGVTSIRGYAFSNCYQLKRISVPKSVVFIDESSFITDTAIQYVTVAQDNEKYCGVNGVLLNKDKSKLLLYPVGNARKSYNIPSGVKEICAGAFAYSKNLTSIGFPQSLTVIHTQAFYKAKNICSIILPQELKRIDACAFYSDFKSVTILSNDCIIYDDSNTICADVIYGYEGSSAQKYVDKNSIGKKFALVGSDLTVNDIRQYSSTGESVDITWSSVDNSEMYYIYLIVNKKTERIETSAENKFTVKQLSPCSTYDIRVRASKGTSIRINGALSATLCVRTGPSSAKNLMCSEICENTAVLTWSPVDTETAYQIYIKDSTAWKLLTVTSNPY